MKAPNQKQNTALRLVAQRGGLIVTQRSAGDAIFSFRDESGGLSTALAKQLIRDRRLIPVDRGLFDDFAQSYRARTPADQ